MQRTTQLSFDSAAEASETLICGLTPSGSIDVAPGSSEDGPGMSPGCARRILDAFLAGRGHGVLHLGAGELGTELHPTLLYWREFGQALVAGVCGALDPTDLKSFVVPDPAPEDLDAFVQSAPPMDTSTRCRSADVRLGYGWSDICRAGIREGVAALPFVPIEVEDYVRLHMEHNPDEDPGGLRARLREALAAWKAGDSCDCGSPIWVVGSATAGHACFTCITMQAVPDDDYEIVDACGGG